MKITLCRDLNEIRERASSVCGDKNGQWHCK